MVFFIGMILILAINFKLPNSKATENLFSKELELKNATLVEVDQEQILGKLVTKYAVSQDKILLLKELKYFTKNIEYMRANEAKLSGYTLSLKGDVKMQEKDGYLYQTQEAIFYQQRQTLVIATPFYASMGKNILEGKRLLYNLKEKKIYARDIKTNFTTCKK